MRRGVIPTRKTTDTDVQRIKHMINRSHTMVDSMRATGWGWQVRALCTIDSDLGYFPRPELWSRLGESNPGPAHYEETGPHLLWRLLGTTVAALTPLGAPVAPFGLISHHV